MERILWASQTRVGEMRAEYEFTSMRGAVRGKYAKRYRAGTNLILLQPDLARAFPTDTAVNNALRAVLRISKVLGRANRVTNKPTKRTARAATRR